MKLIKTNLLEGLVVSNCVRDPLLTLEGSLWHSLSPGRHQRMEYPHKSEQISE